MKIKKFKNKTVAFTSVEPQTIREQLAAIAAAPALANSFKTYENPETNENDAENLHVA